MDSGSVLEVRSGWRCSNLKRLASPSYMVGGMCVSMYVIHGSSVVVMLSSGGPHSIGVGRVIGVVGGIFLTIFAVLVLVLAA